MIYYNLQELFLILLETLKKDYNKEVILSAEEQKTYGNRCPVGYQKVRILGK